MANRGSCVLIPDSRLIIFPYVRSARNIIRGAKVLKNFDISKYFTNFAGEFVIFKIMNHISKAQIKLIRSLQQKKFRDETGLFVAEGTKCVEELCKGFELELLIRSQETEVSIQFSGFSSQKSGVGNQDRYLSASPKEIEQMSGLKTPQGVIGVFKKPITNHPSHITNNGLVLALDGIQDPGNLGTIIRTCDWFGVHDIFCSQDTADCYNPKVVQATMGALARVRVHYVDLPAWLQSPITNHHSPINIYGTLLDGKNMYEVLRAEGRSKSEAVLQRSGLTGEAGLAVIIMGNEGNGISQEVRRFITHPLFIPAYTDEGKYKETSDVVESLNVSIATAIVLAEFRRTN